jgi:AcrR family transcriptional regulator
MTEETMPAQGAGNAASADARPAQSGPSPGGPSPPLPPGLDLLWGRRGRGQRGPKPGLSVDAIVAAAIAIADAEGLEAVSMAHVADQLGFTTMSLYRHVTSKEELLQLMWNASAQGAEDLVITGDDWRTRLRMWATIQREMIDRHPWITQMPMAAPPMAPNSLTFVERGLEAMDGSGLADADKLRVIGLISSYTLSEARMAHDAARAARQAQAAAEGGEPQPAWTWGGLVREVADEQTYPRLHRLARSGGLGEDRSGWDEQEEFDFGLDRILDGVEVLIRTAQP